MKTYILNFDEEILSLEQKNKWGPAAVLAYQQWWNNPDSINCLLCAGTELWYAQLMNLYCEFEPIQPEGLDLGNKEELQKMLWEVTSYGEERFMENPDFNAYFGYMYRTKPYYFDGFNGDYDAWVERGDDLVRAAVMKDRENAFAVALSHISDNDSSAFRCACERLWAEITPAQWGSSEVQKYFFRILNGPMYYPGAYGEFA